jgi:hypothetical protein
LGERLEDLEGSVDVTGVGAVPAVEAVEIPLPDGVVHEDAGQEVFTGNLDIRHFLTGEHELDVEEGGFHGADALAAEPGEGEFVQVLGGFGLGELLGGMGEDLFDLLLVLGWEGVEGSVETVTKAVAGRGLLAFGGARTGGMPGVADVGVDLSDGGHVGF